MVSLAELFGSSFIYFLLFTVTLLALWSYVIFAKGTVLPLDPSLLKKDDTLSDKRATKKRSKNKRVSPEKKQESREQVENKPKLAEAKLIIQRTSADSDPQGIAGLNKTEASRKDTVVQTDSSVRYKQKKRKATDKLEQQEKIDVGGIVDDAEGEWKVQLSRQQLKERKEQQRQHQNSHDHQNQAPKEEGNNETLPACEKQSSAKDIAEMTTDKTKDSILNQSVEYNVHCEDPTNIERALKEAADNSGISEVTDTPEAWGSRQHKERMRKKGKLIPPNVEQPTDQVKDQSQDDWVIL